MPFYDKDYNIGTQFWVLDIYANLPLARKTDEAVVLMGHGTHHPANAFYSALQFYLWQNTPHISIGTMEGAPPLEDILAEIQKRGLNCVPALNGTAEDDEIVDIRIEHLKQVLSRLL